MTEKTDLIQIDSDIDLERKNLVEYSARYVQAADTVVVDSTESSLMASDNMGMIKSAIAKIEDKRLSFTKPLNDSLKAINSTFNEPKAPLNAALDMVDRKIHSFRQKERERIEAETAKVQAEENKRQKPRDAHEARGHQVTENPPLAKPLELTQVDPTPVRKDWRWETNNFNQIPREFLQVDEIKVNKAVRDGAREILGIRIFQKETIVNRKTVGVF